MKGFRKFGIASLAIIAATLVALCDNMSVEFAGIIAAVVGTLNWANTKEYK